MRIAIFGLAVCVLLALPLEAEYLQNCDLKDGLSCWRGDGDAAFLKPDGTEGAATDQGAIPVLKLVLSHSEPHLIYQEIDTPDQPKHLVVSVDVYASSDFKRSTYAGDYNVDRKAGLTNYYGNLVIPNVDFWIRGSPGFFYKLTNLKPRCWVTVTGIFDIDAAEQLVINFCAPPGTGTIYLKNPSVSK